MREMHGDKMFESFFGNVTDDEITASSDVVYDNSDNNDKCNIRLILIFSIYNDMYDKNHKSLEMRYKLKRISDRIHYMLDNS